MRDVGCEAEGRKEGGTERARGARFQKDEQPRGRNGFVFMNQREEAGLAGGVLSLYETGGARSFSGTNSSARS